MATLEYGTNSQSVIGILEKLFSRMVGSACLNREVFHELGSDKSRLANGQAVLVAVLVGLSLAAGVSLSYDILDVPSIISSILSNVTLVLSITAAWSGVVFLIATRIFRGSAMFAEFTRQVFFSVTPGVFLVLVCIPLIRPLVWLTIGGWIVVINVFLVKRATGLTSQRSVLTVFVSAWVIFLGAGALGLFS